MNEDKKKYTSDDDIEKLLAPRCEFHVSAGFKEKLMQEAKSLPEKHKRKWIPFAAFTAAAASVAIVIFTALHFFNAKPTVVGPIIVAETSAATLSDADSKKNPSELYANVQEVKDEPPVTIKTKPRNKTEKTKTKANNKQSSETRIQPVTEGEMPMISKDDSMDPEEVRLRLLETRRNAEIAYIDRMRDEIEANQAYIGQLMTLENVSE